MNARGNGSSVVEGERVQIDLTDHSGPSPIAQDAYVEDATYMEMLVRSQNIRV
jgi:hypothetical protein